MNIIARFKKMTMWVRAHVRFTQITVLAWGMVMVSILALCILAWDTHLFFQATAAQKIDTIPASRTSINGKDIQDAIKILNGEQDKFNTILRQITATTTVSF